LAVHKKGTYLSKGFARYGRTRQRGFTEIGVRARETIVRRVDFHLRRREDALNNAVTQKTTNLRTRLAPSIDLYGD